MATSKSWSDPGCRPRPACCFPRKQARVFSEVVSRQGGETDQAVKRRYTRTSEFCSMVQFATPEDPFSCAVIVMLCDAAHETRHKLRGSQHRQLNLIIRPEGYTEVVASDEPRTLGRLVPGAAFTLRRDTAKILARKDIGLRKNNPEATVISKLSDVVYATTHTSGK